LLRRPTRGQSPCWISSWWSPRWRRGARSLPCSSGPSARAGAPGEGGRRRRGRRCREEGDPGATAMARATRFACRAAATLALEVGPPSPTRGSMAGSSISAGLPPRGSMEAASLGGRGDASPLLCLLVAATPVAPPTEGAGPQPPLLRYAGAAARGGEGAPLMLAHTLTLTQTQRSWAKITWRKK
jgi:hypothetical protein